MKIVDVATPVYGSSTQAAKKFDIEFSKKAFQILSSGLYTHKERAFIREYASNAVDGHKALEKKTGCAPKYFDIEMPTILNLQWRIRDYGIGLDAAGIDHLMTTYFASDKTGSDEMIGGFGLGSKSAFAYAQTFTVTSYHGGLKSVYSVYMHDGEPTCLPIHSEPSDEPTGIEIVIPVMESSIPKMEEETRHVFYTFDKDGYMPNFIDGFDYKNISDEVSNRVPDTFKDTVYAIVGGVSYPIQDDLYKDHLVKVTFGNKEFIKFDINELNPTPSRENIQLDEHSLNTLKNYFTKKSEDLNKQVDDIIESGIDPRDVYKKIHNLKNGSNIWAFVKSKKTFKSKTLHQWENFYSNFEHEVVSSIFKKFSEIHKKSKFIYQLHFGFNNTIKKNSVVSSQRQNRWTSTRSYEFDSSFDRGLEIHMNHEHKLGIFDSSDPKLNMKLKNLKKYGYIPSIMYMFDVSDEYLESPGKRYGNAKKIKNVVRPVFYEYIKRLSKGSFEVYHIEKLWEKHQEEILTKNKKERVSNREYVRKERSEEKTPNVTIFKSDGEEYNVYMTAKDISKLDCGYYFVKKSGSYVDKDGGRNYVSDYHVRHYITENKIDIIYVINTPQEPAADRNVNLHRLCQCDVVSNIKNMAKKYIKPDSVCVNMVKGEYSRIPEISEKLNYNSTDSSEVYYLRQRYNYFSDVLDINIEELVTSAKNEIENKVKMIRAKFVENNPIIAELLRLADNTYSSVKISEPVVKEIVKSVKF